jgi:outer membrane protein assembly factor BamB
MPGSSLLFSDGETIYAGSPTGAWVFAINASDGTSRWTIRADVDTTALAWDPVVDGDVVFVAIQRPTNPRTGGVVALNRADGSVRWRATFAPSAPGRGAGGSGRVVLTDSLVIIAANDGTIWALSRETGAVRWTAPRPAEIVTLDDIRPIIRVASRIVAGSTASVLTAYDAATGAVVWRFSRPEMGSMFFPLATDGSSVFVTGSGTLVHVSASGSIVWSAGVSGGTYCFSPGTAVDGERVYASGCEANYAVRK